MKRAATQNRKVERKNNWRYKKTMAVVESLSNGKVHFDVDVAKEKNSADGIKKKDVKTKAARREVNENN